MVAPEPAGLGRLGRAQRRGQHRLDHHLARVERLRAARVFVHHLSKQRLIQRAPVDADPNRAVVFQGHPDHRLEVLVVSSAGADVARVDAVLGQLPRHLGVARQQQVAVVVKVPDQRDVDALVGQPATDLGYRLGCGVVIDRDPHQLRPGSPQLGDLLDRSVHVRGVGVRHGLSDDRVLSATSTLPTATGTVRWRGEIEAEPFIAEQIAEKTLRDQALGVAAREGLTENVGSNTLIEREKGE